jgi:hypothetical protein
MLRKGLTAAGAILVLFHVWLLSGQVWTGALAEPGRILRWLFAFALVAGLVALKRQGGSVWRGRKAVSIWLLAAVLHAPAVGTAGLPAMPEVSNLLAEIAIASVAAAGLRQLLGLRAARKTQHRRTPRDFTVVMDGGAIGVLTADSFLRITPRPPPRR